MAERDPEQPHRSATPLELLFDLCFAVAAAAPGSPAPTTAATSSFPLWFRVRREHSEARRTAQRYAVGVTVIQALWIFRTIFFGHDTIGSRPPGRSRPPWASTPSRPRSSSATPTTSSSSSLPRSAPVWRCLVGVIKDRAAITSRAAVLLMAGAAGLGDRALATAVPALTMVVVMGGMGLLGLEPGTGVLLLGLALACSPADHPRRASRNAQPAMNS